MLRQYRLKDYNFRLIIWVIALSVIGILVIGSAKESVQTKQIAGLILGLVVMVITSLIDYSWVLDFYWLSYFVGIGLLAAVLLSLIHISNYAIVRSIIDDYSNVSAMVTTTEDTCIIAGDLRLIDEGKVNLVKLTDSRDKVTVGDKVVTSDISSRFLPGILIGYISEISMDSNNLTKSGYITPAVDFRHLREVLVIKEQKAVSGAESSLKKAVSKETEGLVNDSTEDSTETAAPEEATTADNGQ